MSKIPADLDALMWTLVESGDLPALDDFEKRFPQFKGELASRIAMVRGLRQSKPAEARPRPIPKFVPKAAPEPAPNRRGVFTVAALGGLAVVALGAYAVIANLPAPQPQPTPELHQPAPVQQPDVVREDPAKGNVDRTPTNPSALPNPPAVRQPWEIAQDFKVEDAPLLDVIQLIATACSLKLEVAPNMPNPNVSVDFRQKTGLDMLKELGREYGFTPLPQEPGEILVIPATRFTDPVP